jgi:hypothetical protein
MIGTCSRYKMQNSKSTKWLLNWRKEALGNQNLSQAFFQPFKHVVCSVMQDLRAAIAAKNQIKARLILKTKKSIEEVLTKRMQASYNIEQIISKINDAHSDQDVNSFTSNVNNTMLIFRSDLGGL